MRGSALLAFILLLFQLSCAQDIRVIDPEVIEAGLLVIPSDEYLDIREVLTIEDTGGERACFMVPSLETEGPDLLLDPSTLPAETSSLVILDVYSCPQGPVESFRDLDDCRKRDPTKITGHLFLTDTGTVIEENATGKRYLLMPVANETVVLRYRIKLAPLIKDLDPTFKLVKAYIKGAASFTFLFQETPCATWSILSHELAGEGTMSTDEVPGFRRVRGTGMTGGYRLGFGLTSCDTVRRYFESHYLNHVDEPAVRELAMKVARRANSSNVERQAEELYYFVRDTVDYKYDRFEPGTDFPERPDHTLDIQLGDCEDMSILLISMLRSIGLDAKLVLMDLDQTGSDFTMQELLSGHSLTFNHVAVISSFKPDQGFDLSTAKFMDTTCKDCLFGNVLADGSPSLIINGNGGIFPAFSAGRCTGVMCDSRCYTELGQCCPEGTGEAWRANHECCNSADCLGNSLCKGGQCNVCDGSICAGVCYSRKEYTSPCCSNLGCGTFEHCERYSCTLDRSYLTTLGAVVLTLIFITVSFLILRKVPCPQCGARISPRARFCTACGEEILSSDEKERQIEIDAMTKYTRSARKSGASFGTIAKQLTKRGYEEELVSLVLDAVREDERSQKKATTVPQHPSKDEDDALTSARRYVLARRKEGFSDAAVRHALKAQDYEPDVIAKVLADGGDVERIKRYITQRCKEGFSDREIQEALSHVGYEVRDVRKAFAALQKGGPPKEPPQKGNV